MADLITMPKLGFDMAEGMLVEWIKQVGDELAEGDVIAIIETDKANVEVTSFKAGVLRQVLVEQGTSVPVGQAIAVIGSADEPIDLAALGLAAAAPEKEAVPAEVGQPQEPAPAAAPAAAEPGRLLASPLAARMAGELGIDLRQVQGSGPGGRIVKRDIEQYLKREAAPKALPPIPTPSHPPAPEGYRAEALSPMRQTIARRMTESKQQVPHFYVSMDVDMEAALQLRQQLNAVLPEDESISVSDLLIKAAALALRQFPSVNASFAGDEIHVHEQVNVGIAVAREAGLVTTVLRECDKKSLAHIARESRQAIARAREGRMRAEEMVGATFTISNLGMFGVENFVAIINPPQAAILAVGAVRRVPVLDPAGQVTVGLRMKVTLSADHRAIDGVQAAQFLQAFQAALEQPMRLVV